MQHTYVTVSTAKNIRSRRWKPEKVLHCFDMHTKEQRIWFECTAQSINAKHVKEKKSQYNGFLSARHSLKSFE